MPSKVGGANLDKLYIGAQEIAQAYLGTQRVFPNIYTWDRYDYYPSYEALGLTTQGTELDISGYVMTIDKNGNVGSSASHSLSIKAGSLFYTPTSARYNDGFSVTVCYAVTDLTSSTSPILYRNDVSKSMVQNAIRPTTKRDTVQDLDGNKYPVNGIQYGYWYIRR